MPDHTAAEKRKNAAAFKKTVTKKTSTSHRSGHKSAHKQKK